MEINVLEFNNKDYYLLKKITYNNQVYCYFMNVNDKYDLCIKKIVVKNGEEYFIGLKDEEELNNALKIFYEGVLNGNN